MAQITITDTIIDSDGEFPTSGTLTFRLSDWMTRTDGKIVIPCNETVNVSSVDGTFTVVLESTTTSTPGTRTYAVTFSGTLEGATVNISLGSFSLTPTPTSQDLSDLLNVGTSAGTTTGNFTALNITGTNPRIKFEETDADSNEKIWDIDTQTTAGVQSLSFRTRTDADGTGVDWMKVTRGSGTAVSTVQLGAGATTVGIGAAPTVGQLDVFGTTNTSARFRHTNASGGTAEFYDTTNTAVRGYIGYGSTVFTGGAIGDYGLSSVAALKLASNSGTVALTIDTSQRVGIGGTNTGAKLYTESASLVSFLGRDTTAYSAGVSGPEIRLQGLDSTSTNNNQFSLTALATASQNTTVSIKLGLSGSTSEVFQWKSNGQSLFADGSASAPSVSFINATTTGMYMANSGDLHVGTNANKALFLWTNGSDRWSLGGTGNFIAEADNSYDFGGTSNRIRTGYFGTALNVGLATNATGYLYAGSQTSTNHLNLEYAASDTNGAALTFLKARGNLSGRTIVNSGDTIGSIIFGAIEDASDYRVAAQILAKVDGTPGASNDMPGRLEFVTTLDGSITTGIRYTIRNNGDHYFNGETGALIVMNEGQGDVDTIIRSDTNANHFVSDAGWKSGHGAFAYGSAASTNPEIFFQVNPVGNFTLTANQSYYHANFASQNAITVPTGTAPIVATVAFNEPNITATGTVSDAYTLYISGAPTEGTRNGALLITSGNVRIDSQISLATDASVPSVGKIRVPTPSSTTATMAAPNSQLFHGVTKSLTDNTLTDLFTIDNDSDGEMSGCVISYTVMVDSGSQIQVETGLAAVSVYNNGGTQAATIAKLGTPVQQVSTGTLTVTFATANDAPGQKIQVTADSSLDFNPTINYTIINNSARAVTIN